MLNYPLFAEKIFIMAARIYRSHKPNMSDENVRKISVQGLKNAITIVGSASKLAAMVGTSRQMIHRFQYHTKRGVSPRFVVAIERATYGLVHRAQLRPDLYLLSEC